MVPDGVTVTSDPMLAGVVILSALVSFPLAILGVLAYRRRRTRSYLLVAVAFLAFLFKSIVGLLTLVGVVSLGSHHLIEHGLDSVVAVLLIGAVYLARDSNRFEELPFDESR